MIRNTTGFEFAVDRAVAHAGHGEHGGYFTSQDGYVICVCGDVLFEIKAVAA